MDDDRAERSLGQVLEQLRQEEHCEDEQHAGDQTGELGLLPRRVRGCGARVRTDRGKPAEQTAGGVRRAQSGEFDVGVDAFTVAGAERFRQRHRLAEHHHGEPKRRRHQIDKLLPAHVGQAGSRQT